MAKARKSLRERAIEMTTLSPLMTNREKGDQKTLIGEVITIKDFDFVDMTGEDGENHFVVYHIEEDDKRFFMGGKVLTKTLEDLETEGYGNDIRTDGLPLLMETKDHKTIKGRTYTALTLYPEV